MNDLTQGAVGRHILKLSGFIAFTALSQTLYFLIDLYFVSRLGKEAIAGVGIVGNLAIVLLALTQVLNVGTTALVAQALGRKDRAHAELVLNQSVLMALVAGGLFALTVFAWRASYCSWLAADAATAAQAFAYLGWFVPALALMIVAAPMGATQRGMGELRAATAIQVGIIVLNIALAPLLIFGWGPVPALGVAGASLATLLAVAAGCAAYVVLLRRPDAKLRLRAAAWTPQPAIWRAILKIGVPTGAEVALAALTLFLIYDLTRAFGSAAQAGFGIGMRILQALSLPASAIGFATAPVAAQNFGAGLGARVKQTFLSAASMSVATMFMLMVLCQVGAPAMTRFFDGDPEVVRVGTEYLRIGSLTLVTMGLAAVSASLFQAMGNTWPALASSALRLVLFALPAYLLAAQAGFQLRQLWYLSVTASVLQAGMTLWLLQREFARRLGQASDAAWRAAEVRG